jgi:hypothetical protein
MFSLVTCRLGAMYREYISHLAKHHTTLYRLSLSLVISTPKKCEVETETWSYFHRESASPAPRVRLLSAQVIRALQSFLMFSTVRPIPNLAYLASHPFFFHPLITPSPTTHRRLPPPLPPHATSMLPWP